MWPYLLVFAVSMILFMLSDKTSGVLQRIFTVSGLLGPCVIAGCRDLSIGTDVRVYVTPVFNSVKGLGLLEGHELFPSQPVLFYLILWLVANTINDVHVALGLIQAICILPIYFAAKLLLPRKTTYCMLIYYLIAFLPSMNMMKQYCAISLIVLSTAFAVKGQIKPYIMTLLAAVLFHQTAFIFIPLFWVCKLMMPSHKLRTKERGYVFFICLIFMCLIFALTPVIIKILPLLRDSYQFILDNEDVGYFDQSSFIALIALAIFHLFFWRKNEGMLGYLEEPEIYNYNLIFFYEMLSGLGWILMQLNLFANGISRIAYYLTTLNVIFIPLLTRCKKNSIVKYYQLLMIILYTYMLISGAVIAGNDAVVPYKSELLGIA